MKKPSANVRCLGSLLLPLLILTCLPQACAAANIWKAFLDKPSASHRDQIATKIGECRGSLECRKALRPGSDDVRRLVALIEAQRPEALEVGFLAMSTLVLSGGDYEDVMEAVAGQIALQPKLFLSLTQEHYRDPELLTKMPMSTVDNPTRRQAITQERIAALQSVSDPSLSDAKDWALGVLRGSPERARGAK